MHQEVNPSAESNREGEAASEPFSESEPTAPRPAKKFGAARLIAYSIALAACLIPIRAWVVGWNWEWILHPTSAVPKVVASGAYDVLFVACFAIAMLIPVLLLRKKPRAQKAWFFAFVVLGFGIIAFCYANIDVVAMLGRPLNYQWLYYSGFLMSRDARDAMKASGSSQTLLIVVWFCVMMIAIGEAVFRAMRWGAKRFPGAGFVAAPALIVLLAVYIGCSHWWLTTRRWPMLKLMNPVWSIASSLVESVDAPQLYTMKTPLEPDDVRCVADRAPAAQPSSAPHEASIKNVIIFVFESLPAEYVDLYGAKFGATPNLSRLSKHAAVFDGIYAHAPATNKSLESILCAVYSLLSYQSLTSEHPDIATPSLASELKKHGYRSGFFSSTDLAFQRTGDFLRHRPFDHVEDFHNRGNGRAQFTSEWSDLHGSDEMINQQAMNEWIAGQPATASSGSPASQPTAPFFAMSWSMQTHYPYYTSGPVRDFKVNEDRQNKYLNALQQEDAALGWTIDTLEKKGLLDSTLVLVLGDHGEAFGQHGQFGHGAWIYDENVRIPLLLINPKLFHGERHKLVGGLCDLAPTIFDILNLPPAGAWQGRSLFAGDRPNRVYFFAPWSDLVFGLRDGDQKFIYNATHNTWEMFDLSKDPRELKSIAGTHPKQVGTALYRMAAWVQYQKAFHEKLIKGK
ncbi:MAG TPA: sulfatase [Tepidisphaeraceae bacterium]|nr:sulfatase [Tepidisphaeraceae bacterium]